MQVPLPEIVQGVNTREGTEDRHAFALQVRQLLFLNIYHSNPSLLLLRAQEVLHQEHRVEVPVKCLEGRLYLRLSAHIYNSLDQYERLAFIVKNM